MFEKNKIYNLELITKAEKITFNKKDSFSVMQKAANACSNYILSKYKPKNSCGYTFLVTPKCSNFLISLTYLLTLQDSKV